MNRVHVFHAKFLLFSRNLFYKTTQPEDFNVKSVRMFIVSSVISTFTKHYTTVNNIELLFTFYFERLFSSLVQTNLNCTVLT